MSNNFCSIVFLLFVSACTISSSKDEKNIIYAISNSKDFKVERIMAGNFLLTTLHKGLDLSENNITIYIEGDGNAWRNKYNLSSDPTPKNPIGLKMATIDPSASILYIARPCMFLKSNKDNKCSPKYWSSHRYSEEVVFSINEVINHIVTKFPNRKLTIIGYSGGGVIAALVAAKRNDVAKLVTVAANLDHEYWADLHNVTLLSGSESPVNYVRELSHIKQIHFLGKKDKIVPRSVVDSFIDKLNKFHLAEVIIIDDFNHECCWAKEWPEFLKKFIQYN